MKRSLIASLAIVALAAFAMSVNDAAAAACDLRIGPCAPGATKPVRTPAGNYQGGSGSGQGNRAHGGGGDKPHSTPTSSGPVNPPPPNPLPDK
jgi:hypothetical protein